MNYKLEQFTSYLAGFGLTALESRLLRWSMQGVLYRPDQVPDDPAGELAACVTEARDGFADIQSEFGTDPADPNAPADRTYEYTDLVEKLAALDEAKAAHLYFFMIGYLAAWERDE